MPAAKGSAGTPIGPIVLPVVRIYRVYPVDEWVNCSSFRVLNEFLKQYLRRSRGVGGKITPIVFIIFLLVWLMLGCIPKISFLTCLELS